MDADWTPLAACRTPNARLWATDGRGPGSCPAEGAWRVATLHMTGVLACTSAKSEENSAR